MQKLFYVLIAGFIAVQAFADLEMDVLVRRAETGDSRAQFDLAEHYSKGGRIQQSWPTAFDWYEKAAQQNLPEAQYALALCYAAGTGVDQNDQKALQWLDKAADFYYAPAQYKLGKCYETGELGLAGDPVKAVKWMRLAASQEMPEAYYSMGQYYLNGTGVKPDVENAVAWFFRGGEKNDAQCVQILLENFIDWSSYMPDAKRYLNRLVRNADRGNVDSQITLGSYYLSIGSDQKAIPRLTTAAEQGSVDASRVLFEYYRAKSGTEESRRLALAYGERCAETGSEKEQETLARLYAESSDAADLKKALHWHLVAAKRGHVESQIRCIFIYGGGSGVPKNRVEAYAWALVVEQNGKKAYARSLEPILTIEEKTKAMRRFRALLWEIK